MGERSRRGRGGPAPPDSRHPPPPRPRPGGAGRADTGAPPRGTPPRGSAPAGESAGRGESAATGLAPSAPGFGERCCRGAVTLGGGGPAAAVTTTGPPRATFPAGLPSRPGAGRGAPPRWKCARRRPVAGRGAVPRRPHPRPRPPTPAAPPPPTPARRRRDERRGAEGGRVEGSGGTGSGKDPPGRRHGRARRRVESSGRTARTPPVYLLTVSRPLELSLQSSFQLSLTVLVDYRSRAGI